MNTQQTAGSHRLQLWSARAYYFSVIGGYGFLFPFLGLFYSRQGLSGTEIGWISTLTAVTALIAAPLWGRWSDAIAHPRRLLQISLALTGLTGLWLGQQHQFGGIGMVIILQTFIGAGAMPLSDILVLGLVRRANKGFGSVRLGGSLGWAVVTTLSGRLIEMAGLAVAFTSYAAGMGFSALIAGFLPDQPADIDQGTAVTRSSLRQVILDLRHNRVMVGLAIALAFTWFGSAALRLFETIYLDELGASEGLIGFASAIPGLVELGGMLWADRLEKRYGAGWMLRMAVLFDAGRFLIILLSPTIATIVILRIVDGIRFSLYSVAILAITNRNAPGRQSVTVLALYTVTLRNLVQMISSPFGGLVFDAFGIYWLYAAVLAGNLLGWVVLKLTNSE